MNETTKNLACMHACKRETAAFLIVMVAVMLQLPVQVGSVDDTHLLVHLVEADTGLERGGDVTVTYDSSTMTRSCGFKGHFTCSFYLGTYTGNVTVTTGATLDFKSTTTTVYVQPGYTEVTVQLYRHDIPWNFLLPFSLLVGVVVAFAVGLRKPLRGRTKLRIAAAIYGFQGAVLLGLAALVLVGSLLHAVIPGMWGLSIILLPLGGVFVALTYGLVTRKSWARWGGLALSILAAAYCAIYLFLCLGSLIAWLQHPERFGWSGLSFAEPVFLAVLTANLLCIYYLMRGEVKAYFSS